MGSSPFNASPFFHRRLRSFACEGAGEDMATLMVRLTSLAFSFRNSTPRSYASPATRAATNAGVSRCNLQDLCPKPLSSPTSQFYHHVLAFCKALKKKNGSPDKSEASMSFRVSRARSILYHSVSFLPHIVHVRLQVTVDCTVLYRTLRQIRRLTFKI
jgi:hypothetical protein